MRGLIGYDRASLFQDARLAYILTVTPSPALDASTSVPTLKPFSKLRCGPMLRHPGGGGVNVARVIERLGGDVLAVYPAGGAIGQLVRQLLDAEGVKSLVIPVAPETREDFTVFEDSTRKQYRFVLPGEPLSEAEWQPLIDAVTNATPAPAFVVASGSLPPGVPDDFFARVVHAGRARGAKVIVDTSHEALDAALAAGGIYLIKPSMSEIRTLTGVADDADQATLIAAGRALIARGAVELVALSMGPSGALLISRDHAWRAEGMTLDPASVVGAGDSLVAAMVWRLAEGASLEDALRFGVAAGSAALLNPGTSLCQRQDIDGFVPQICLRDVGALASVTIG
jgi:6-phosphofructokinase 2